MKLELELEQEADGRWLAEFTRFPGAMGYGPSKEEAIRNAAKVLIEAAPHFTPMLGDLLKKVVRLTDGVTHKEQVNSPLWLLGCEIYDDLCDRYGSEALRREGTSEQAPQELASPIAGLLGGNLSEYSNPPLEQASPTPDKCPSCRSKEQNTFLTPYCPDSWHYSSGTPKGSK